MKIANCNGIIVGGIAAALLGIATVASRAQVVMNWPLQNFTGNICGWQSLTANVTLTYDPTQDNSTNGGGSCLFSADYSGTGLDVLGVRVNNVGCCCDLDTLLYLSDYASVDFDVKWDNLSTISLTAFNNSMSGGIQIVAGGATIGSFVMPAAATNGWAHVTVAVDLALTNVTFPGIAFESFYQAGGGGTAAFWMDNVQLTGRTNQVSLWPAASPGGVFTLKWNAAPGYTYTVQRSMDLSNWTNLVSGYPSGGATGTSVSYTDTNAPPAHALYRVSSP